MTAIFDALTVYLRDRLPVEDDWDDEGSPGYSDATVERAVRFLLGAPMSPGPDGSIDFTMALGDAQLLVNLPSAEDEDQIASFSLIRKDGVIVFGRDSMAGQWTMQKGSCE